jgi:hypothetical protein
VNYTTVRFASLNVEDGGQPLMDTGRPLYLFEQNINGTKSNGQFAQAFSGGG